MLGTRVRKRAGELTVARGFNGLRSTTVTAPASALKSSYASLGFDQRSQGSNLSINQLIQRRVELVVSRITTTISIAR